MNDKPMDKDQFDYENIDYTALENRYAHMTPTPDQLHDFQRSMIDMIKSMSNVKIEVPSAHPICITAPTSHGRSCLPARMLDLNISPMNAFLGGFGSKHQTNLNMMLYKIRNHSPGTAMYDYDFEAIPDFTRAFAQLGIQVKPKLSILGDLFSKHTPKAVASHAVVSDIKKLTGVHYGITATARNPKWKR